MNLIHSGSEFQALLLLIVLNQTDKMGMRAIKAIFGENMPKMHRFQNTSNYPKLPEIRICGRLTVFAGVCGFFAGVLRVVLVAGFCKTCSQSHIVKKQRSQLFSAHFQTQVLGSTLWAWHLRSEIKQWTSAVRKPSLAEQMEIPGGDFPK